MSNEKVQVAARRMVCEEGIGDLVVLNCASAKKPGGGFRRGTRGQEEDIVRATGLITCLAAQPVFYEANRACGSFLYTDHIIYSPRVPWFRSGSGVLLDNCFAASIITAPAPNAAEARRRGQDKSGEIRNTLVRRAGYILAVAADRGHRSLLLGAWGCGAFGNDPGDVADIFMLHLRSRRFRDRFDRVVFAVHDPTEAGETFRAFRRRVR